MANQTAFSPTGMLFSKHVSDTSGSLVPRPQATPFMPAFSFGNSNPLGFSPFLGSGCPSPPAACFNSALQSDPAVSSLELGPLAPLQVGLNGLNFAGAPLVADPLTDPRIANKQLAFQALSNGGHLILCRLFVGGLPNNASEEELKSVFKQFGSVREVKIISDKQGTSKGYKYTSKEHLNLFPDYGFVTYETHDSVEEALLPGKDVKCRERKLNLSYAVKKQNRGESSSYSTPNADLSNVLSAYLLAQLSACSANFKIASCLSMVNAESLRKSMQAGMPAMALPNPGLSAGALASPLLSMQPALLPGAAAGPIQLPVPIQFALPYPLAAAAAFAMPSQGGFVPFACDQLTPLAIGGEEIAVPPFVDGQLIEVMADGQHTGSHILMGFSGSGAAVSPTITSSGMQSAAELPGSQESISAPGSASNRASNKPLAEVKGGARSQSADWVAPSSGAPPAIKW